VSLTDSEQFIPNERRTAEKGEEGVTTPADLGTPELSLESDAAPEDSTSDGVADPLRLLGLSVIGRAIEDGNRDWFFSSRSRDIFRFWCQVAKLQPGWV